MASKDFVHLHCHTHFSLLDGANRIGDLVGRCKALGMNAIAVTDHGNMFGAIDFYSAAMSQQVKPIIGCECYIAPGDRRDREAKGMKEASQHLVLLAKDLAGYRNLLKLASSAYLEGFYYRPRIDRELLAEHREGLIAISGHLGTELATPFMHGDDAGAREAAAWYREVFGKENFYVELQRHGQEEQERLVPELIRLAEAMDLQTVVTNDVHYLTQDEAFVQEVMLCINTGKTLAEEQRMRMETDQLYLKSPEEMYALFAEAPQACANTVKIAEMCNVVFDFSQRFAPVFAPPAGKTDAEYLRELVYEGATWRYGEVTDAVRERIDYELGVIESKDFSSYFLIFHDVVKYARSHSIPCGARGSGCSTVVGHCLGLSQPDPLRYELYFERFMDPERNEMPDIDLDICQNGRADLIEYVREKYGHVAQVITFGTLKARAAIRDVCRVLDVPLADADRIAKLIPAEVKMTIDKALDREPELKQEYDKSDQVKQVIDISRRLEGLARHASVHAAAVVIADKPLDQFLPLYRSAGSDAVMTQFEGPTVEKIGLLKMDFLGLRTLTVIERTIQLVKTFHGVTIDREALDLTDARVYEVFANGWTKGVFQFESGGMADVLMKMKPNRIEDLIAANALYRPGPMVNIDAYVSRKHGESWTTPHPIMTEVLNETYGIMVYQEQVSRMVNRLGGLPLPRAFRLAKAISKKNLSMIEAERGPFEKGCLEKGLTKAQSDEIFEEILRFGGYAFNKSHSTGYALVAYQTAYLKTYYPVEFMAALLTFEMVSTDKVVEYIEECKRMQIEVRPPDVNSSGADFTVVYPNGVKAAKGKGRRGKPHIRFGLGAIKGVGGKAVDAVFDARERGGPFKDIFDFCERVDPSVVNRAAVEAMIKAGAFDTTGAMRKALVEVLESAVATGAGMQRDQRKGQATMFDMFGAAPEEEQAKTIPTSEWSESEMLAHEKSVLGLYVTAHPLSQHADLLEKYSTIDTVDLPSLPEGMEVALGGMIARVRTTVTKSGRNAGAKMAFVVLEDLKGSMEVTLFSKVYDQYRHLVGPEMLVFLKGKVDCRREQPTLLVDEIFSLDVAAEKLADRVLLRLNCAVDADDILAKIQDLCDAHSGDCQVFIGFATRDGLSATMRCNGKGSHVRPSKAFVAAAHELLGADHVMLINSKRRVRKPAPVEEEEDLLEAEALLEEEQQAVA